LRSTDQAMAGPASTSPRARTNPRVENPARQQTSDILGDDDGNRRIAEHLLGTGHSDLAAPVNAA
jgi:hypothetical protein